MGVSQCWRVFERLLSAGPQPGGRLESGGGCGKHSSHLIVLNDTRAFGKQLLRAEGLQQLRAIETMGPDIDFAHGWTGKSEDLKWEQHSLQEKVMTSATAQDDHAISGVAIGTILMGRFVSANPQVEIRIVQ